MISIEQLKEEKLDDFFEYLTKHLSENGINNTLRFQPFTKKQSKLSTEWKVKFENGLNKDFKTTGWRKLWVATNELDQIVGHIDIRSHIDQNTDHRVLLGMGVDSNFRKMKIGRKLIQYIVDYCKRDNDICWIDLQVLTNNIPAIRLYENLNFQSQSIITDMYRIDNKSYDYMSMNLNVDTTII